MRERLDEILDRAAVGIAQLDTGGRYLLVNDRYCEMLGRTREELLSSHIHDITHSSDLAASLDAFIRVIETGRPMVVEQCCVRGDGSTIWVSNSVSPGYDEQGQPQFVVAFVQDTAEQRETRQLLTRAQSDLRMVLDSTADALYCIDMDARTTLCNAAFLRMLGYRREADVLGKDLHALIHHSRPDGSAYPLEDCPIYKVTQSGIHVHVMDELFFRADGTNFPVEYWVRPIVRDGEIQGAVCTFVDMTERKKVDARQELLNRELAHRVKNTLAMVQAIVGQTLRGTPSSRDAVRSINQRLAALGNAHSVLMRTRWGNASVMDVVEGAIAPHRSEPHRIQVTGPMVDLGSKAALAITMALHELCTNAAKYGALSNDAGTVSIAWTVTGGAADSTFRLTWKERGGPPVKPPQRKGFGSRLVAEAVGSDLRGRTELRFDPEGVHWALEAPVNSIR